MDSEFVFGILQELFPLVDARILKAVAIEHHEDPDAAAEVVIKEILPRISNSSDNQGSYSGIDDQGLSGFIDPSSSSGYKNRFLSSSAYPRSSSVSRQPSFSRVIKFRESSPKLKYPWFAPRERRVANEHLMRPYPRRGDINVDNSPHPGPGSPSGHSASCGSLQSARAEDRATTGNFCSSDSDNLISPRKATGPRGEVSLDQITCVVSDETLGSNNTDSDQEKRGWGFESEEQTAVVKCPENNNSNVAQEEFDLAGLAASLINGEDGICAGAERHELKDSTVLTVGDLQMSEKENHHVYSSSDNTPLALESLVVQIESTHVEDGTQSLVHIPVPSSSGLGASSVACELNCSNDLSALTFMEECPRKERVNSEDPKLKSVIEQSGGLCRTGVSENIIKDVKNCEISCSNDPSAFNFVEEFPRGEMVNSEDPYSNYVLTQSGQAYKTDVLEGLIENAKSYKETLFSGMESVISMTREVEYHEKAAEDAKEEAAKGGLAILDKVEELKRMLLHAKEANCKNAGEVYGEKAILATEVKELQLRLLSLSDEKDDSIAALDMMRQTLETRLSVAEEVRKAAEMEKLDREVSAKKALAEQEAIMEMVVQESELIQEQAEENSKLREFLVDRGRVLDALQGEISVIFKDVKLLKEKLDQRIPLSESVSSLSTCRLASSNSSFKSKSSDLVMVTDQSDAYFDESSMILKENAGSSADDQSVESVQGEVSGSSNLSIPSSGEGCQSPRMRMLEEGVKFDQEILVDDGWEICDGD